MTPAATAPPKRTAADFFCTLTRDFVIHQMETSESLESRFIWSALYLSVCGPVTRDYCVEKDAAGFLVKDEDQAPQKSISTDNNRPPKSLEKLANIKYIFDLADRCSSIPSSTASRSRVWAAVVQKGMCHKDGSRIIVDKRPAMPQSCAAAAESGVISLGKIYNIGGKTFSTMGLPEEVRTEIEASLELIHEEFNTGLKNLRYEHRDRAVQLMDYAHSQVLRRIEEEKKSSSSSLVTAPEETTTTILPDPEEEPEPEEPPIPEAAEEKTLPVEERTPEHVQIARAMRRYGPADEASATILLRKCRHKQTDATVGEMLHFIALKGPLAQDKHSPAGFLLTAVPNCFEGQTFLDWRREQAAANAPPPPITMLSEEEDIEETRALWKGLDPKSQEEARRKYGDRLFVRERPE